MDTSDLIGKRLASASSSGYMNGKKKGGFFRRHKKTPSSPARLVGNILPRGVALNNTNDDSISLASTTSLSSQESYTSMESAGKVDTGDYKSRSMSHQRRYSAEGSPSIGLRRGRPNTVGVGLMEPVKRRSLDPANSTAPSSLGPIRQSSQREINMSPERPDCLNFSPVAFDTSPIPHKGDLQMLDCSPIGMDTAVGGVPNLDLDNSELHDESEFHQTSIVNMTTDDVTPTAADGNMTHLESDHERAFIEESVCGEPAEESKLCETTSEAPDAVFKKPMAFAPLKPKDPPAGLTESQIMDSSVNSDASDTSVITVIYNGQPVPSKRPQPIFTQAKPENSETTAKKESGDATTETTNFVSENAQMDTTSGDNQTDENTQEKEKLDNTNDPTGKPTDLPAGVRESLINLRQEQAGRVASTVSVLSEPDPDAADVALRHATPLRFHNSVSRRRGTSPVRIPTIFAKADKEAAMYREITRNVMRGSVRSGVKGKANLPISTNLVRSTSVENARRQLAGSTPENVTGEVAPSSAVSDIANDSMAGHTPVRHPTNPEFQAVEINESLLQTIDDVCTPKSEKVGFNRECRSPLQDSTNIETTNEALPRIKQPMLVTDVGNRLLAKSLQYRINSTTTTPVRRSRPPIKSVKRLQGSPHSPLSPAKSPKRYRQTPKPSQLSPIPTHVLDWNV